MAQDKIFLSPPHLTGKEWDYVKRALDSGWVAPLGPEVDKFEEEMCEYIGTKGAVAMVSGTAAIHIALELLGVEAGDRVFCSSLTFIASAAPILYKKAMPVFIDSKRSDWNICPEALEIALAESKRKNQLPKAIIVVDLFGVPADYEKINQLAKFYNVPIIEDAAEALGSKAGLRMCGSFGEFSILSFNGNKIITTSGGGMLLSNNTDLLKKALFLITQARDEALHYQHSVLGYNYRMSNILAAIGRAQLEAIEERVNQKREVFDRYKDAFSKYDFINFMPEAISDRSNRWLTTLTLDSEKTEITPLQVIAHLNERNIDARPVWKPLHLQPLFSDSEFYSVNCDEISISEDLFMTGICLPSGGELIGSKQTEVIDYMDKLFV